MASLHWGFINVPRIQLEFRVQSIDDTDLKLLTIKNRMKIIDPNDGLDFFTFLYLSLKCVNV